MRRFVSFTLSCLLAAGGVSAPFASAAAATEPPSRATEGWTRTSYWKRLPDGRVEVKSYGGPAFARRGSTWVPVDARLGDSGDNAAPFSAPGALLPMKVGATSGRIVQLDLPNGPVRLAAPGLRIGRPERAGNVVTYRDVATDTDLVVEVTGQGVRTQLVLRSANAPTSFQLRLDDPNDQLGDVRETDEGFEFTKKIDGDLLLKASRGYAYEQAAAGDDALAGSERGTASLAIREDAAGFVLEKSVDRDWLQGKKFPIVLDPEVYLEGVADTTDCHLVNGAKADTNYCTGTSFEIGYHGADALTRRALLKFALPAMEPNSTVDTGSGELYLVTNITPTATTTAPTYDVYEVNTSWSTNVTWNRKTATANWGTAGGTWYTGAKGSAVMERVVGDASVFPLNTAMIQKWATTPSTNFGMIVKARSETTQTMLRFGSSNHADQPQWPLLVYTYTEPPGAPQNVQVPATGIERGRARVQWVEPYTTDPIATYLVNAVCASDGCPAETNVYECIAPCTSQWVDVAGGHSYTFQVRARDNRGRTGPIGESASVFVPAANKAPLVPDGLLPTSGSKLRSSPRECGRYYDPDGDPGTLLVDVRTADGGTVAANVATSLLTSNSTGCVGPALGDGVYEWDALASDGLLMSPRTAVQTFLVDGTPPAAPGLTSSTHQNPDAWYAVSGASVAISATDLSGIEGHSWVRDTTLGTLPDEVIDLRTSTLSLTVPDGDNRVHVRSCNGTGLCGVAGSYRLRVDTVKPNVPVVSSSHTPGSWSNDSTVDVSWPTPYDATSGVLGYRTLFSQSATDVPQPSMNSTMTTQTSQTLTNGDWWFHMQAVDRAGNVSDVVHRGPFKIDATLPAVPVLSSSSHTASVWSSNNQVRFVWSATDAASGISGYSWSLDDSATVKPDLVSDGLATEVTLTAPDAQKYFHVRALDAAGNWSEPSEFLLRVDATAAAVSSITSSTHPSDAAWYASATPTLSWAASDVSGITGYSYVLDQIATTVPDTLSEGTATTKSYTTPLADGVWYFHVRAVNGSGLVGPALHRKLMIDTTAPAAPAVSSAHSQTAWSALRNVTFTWTQAPDVSNIAGYAVVFDQVPGTVPAATVTTTSASQTFANVADGTWYVHVRSINGALLASTTTTYKVLVDGTAAALTTLSSSTHPNDTKWYSADDVSVQFAATDISGIAGYSYVIDQQPTTTPDGAVDTTTTGVSVANLADGVWYVHVLAVNGAGLVGPPSTIKVLVDDTLPTTTTVKSPDHPVNMTTNQRVVNLDWTDGPGSDAMAGLLGYDVVFTTSAVPLTSAVTAVTTTQTTFTSPSLADGTWYAHVRALDKAFNAGPDYVYGPIHIDPTANPVSDAERDRFISLWKPRVTSDTFGKPYLESPGYPTSILFEGFHGYNPVQKAYLVDKLWTALVAEHPIPAGQEATERIMRDEVYDFVFAKEKFLLPQAESELVDDALRPVLPEVPVLQPLLELLNLRAGRAIEIPDLDVTTLPELGTDDVLSDVEDTLEPLTEDATAVLSAETDAALGYLQNQLRDTLDDLTAEVDAVLAETVGLDTSAVFDVLDLLPVDAGYTVCHSGHGRSGCQRVAVVGTPALVDLTGDGTADVEATLAPAVNATDAVGVGFAWYVRRARTPSDLAGKPMKAHVYATYDIPMYNTRVKIGFDGQRGRLSEESHMDLTMTDPTRLEQRDLLAKYQVTHEDPSTWEPWAVTLGVRRLEGDADPTEARLEYAPPYNAHGDLHLVNDDTDTARDRTIKFTSKMDNITQLTINANETVAARSERTDVALRIPKLQRDTALTLVDKAAGGDDRDFQLGFTGNQRTPEVSAHATIKRGTERLRMLATLKDVPTSVSYRMTNRNGDGHHVYSANGTLGSLAAAAEIVNGAVRHGTATLRAGSIPASMELRHTPDPSDRERILIDYTAAGVVPRLDVSGYYRPEALALRISVKDIPALLTAEADTRLKHVSFDAPTPITLLDATVTRKTTKVSRLAGEHATIITPVAGTFGLSARIAGLTSATFDMGNVMTARTTVVPGGQKFSIGGQIGSIFFSADVSNLPGSLRLDLDRLNLRMYYLGSSTVPRIRGYAGLRPGGPHIEATLTQVPSEVTVEATPGLSKGVITYTANTPLGSIDRIVATSDGTVGDKKGMTIQGRITRLPRTATLTADRTLRSFSFDGDQAVGEIDLTMSRNGARPQRTAKNHLTLSGTSTAWALGVRLANVKSGSLDMSQGITHSSGSLTMSTAGQEFVANGNLDGVRFYASLSNLPTSFSYDANGTQELTYATSVPIDKLVLYVAKTGTGPTLRGAITATPSSGRVNATLAKPRYSISFTGSAPMTSAKGFYSSRYVDAAATATTDFISGSAKGLPTWFTTQIDTATSQVSFSSDRGLDEVQARAKGLLVDGLNAEALLRDLPANVHVHYDINDALFDALGGKIGYAFARGSNYAAPPKRLPGRHVYLRADLPRKYFDASAELTNISTVKVKRTGADLELVGNVDIGTSKLELDLRADFYPPGTTSGAPVRVLVDGSVVGFPSQLKVERVGDVVTYHANRTLDANLEIGAGYPLALNRAVAPKARNGISITDGQCAPNEGCPTLRPDGAERLFCQSDRNRCLGFRGRIDYTGLPTDVTVRLDPQNNVFVTTSELMPTSTKFQARADLQHFTPWPIMIDASIAGVLPGTTLAVGPVKLGKLDATGGAHIRAKVNSNRDLGRMEMRVKAGAVLDFANYRYRDFDVSAEIAKVPQSFDATVEFGYQSRLRVLTSAAMPGEAIEVHAYATVQQEGSTPGTFTTLVNRAAADLYLEDVPASATQATDLAIKMPAPNRSGGPIVMPGLRYTSPGSTLDGALTIHPSWGHLLLPVGTGLLHGNLTRASVEFDNLSSDLSVVVDPTTYDVAVETGIGAPATARLSAQLDGLDANVDMAFNVNTKIKGVRLKANGFLDARAQVAQTRVEMVAVRSLYITPGKFKAAYGVVGDYGKLQVHVSGINLDVDADILVKARPWPDWSWAPDLFYAYIPYNLDDHKKFQTHVYAADQYGQVGGCFRTGVMSARLYTKPGLIARQNNTIVLDGTDTRRKVVMFADPGNLALLSNVLDILVATVEDPYDTGDWYMDTAWGNGAC